MLEKREFKQSENKDIILKGTSLYTYRQQKSGFNNFYIKRVVQSDGVSTKVLDLTLTPTKLKAKSETSEEEEIPDAEFMSLLQENY